MIIKKNYKTLTNVDGPYNRLIYSKDLEIGWIASPIPSFADNAFRNMSPSSLTNLTKFLEFDDKAYFTQEFKEEIILQKDI